MNQCISCNKLYDPYQKTSILRQAEQSQSAGQKQRASQGRFTPLASQYPNTCLQCIQDELITTKQQYQNNLKAGAIELNIAREAYNIAAAKHTSLINKHESFDEQQAYIAFWLAKANDPKVAKASKTSSSKKVPSAKSQADLIASLLKQLSPEQQKAIIQAGMQL
jgi:hypothetical protein